MTSATIAISIGFILLFFAWLQRPKFKRNRRAKANRRMLQPQQPQLERKLLKLLGSNHKTAYRIIEQSRLKYPDKSADWHWEKAIYDLERDRWR
jgi:hypothetical protein